MRPNKKVLKTLNLSYLNERDKQVFTVNPTHKLTQKLFYHLNTTKILSDEQVAYLITDIDKLKGCRSWDHKQEQETLRKCKKSIDKIHALKNLAPEDRELYHIETKKLFKL